MRLKKLAVLWTLLAGTGAVQAVPQGTDRLVAEMLQGVRRRQTVPVPHLLAGPLTMDQAYDVQDAFARAVAPVFGPVIGYKVAYASAAAQRQFGMDGPAAGPLFLAHRLPAGSHVRAEDFMTIMLEIEVAFTLGRRIDAPLADVEALRPYVQWVHPAFDMSEYRYQAGEKPTPADMVAGGTGGYYHLIGPAIAPDRLNVDDLRLQLFRNGETIADSRSSAVMGSPWNSLLWLVNHVTGRGAVLDAGTVVSTGTAAPALKGSGDAIRGYYLGDAGPLGRIEVTIE